MTFRPIEPRLAVRFLFLVLFSYSALSDASAASSSVADSQLLAASAPSFCEAEAKAWLKVKAFPKDRTVPLADPEGSLKKLSAGDETRFRQFRADLEKLWSPSSLAAMHLWRIGSGPTLYFSVEWDGKLVLAKSPAADDFDYAELNRDDCRVHEVHHRSPTSEFDLQVDQACPDLARLELHPARVKEGSEKSSLQSIWDLSSSALRRGSRSEKSIAVDGIRAWFESRNSQIEWTPAANGRRDGSVARVRQQIVHAKRACVALFKSKEKMLSNR